MVDVPPVQGHPALTGGVEDRHDESGEGGIIDRQVARFSPGNAVRISLAKLSPGRGAPVPCGNAPIIRGALSQPFWRGNALGDQNPHGVLSSDPSSNQGWGGMLPRMKSDVRDVDPARSSLMKKVRQRDTSAEVAVRRLLHGVGARFRINVRGLPGTPDIVNKSRKKAVFVHGCFWHYHEDCPRGRIPKNNRDFWIEKLEGNRARDQRKRGDLEDLGYNVCTVWECELTDEDRLRRKLARFWFN